MGQLPTAALDNLHNFTPRGSRDPLPNAQLITACSNACISSRGRRGTVCCDRPSGRRGRVWLFPRLPPMTGPLVESKRVQEFFQAHAGLPQHALECLGQDRIVIRNGDADRTPAHSDVRTSLITKNKTQPLEGANGFTARNVPWKFHAVARTASLRNRSRMRSGNFSPAK